MRTLGERNAEMLRLHVEEELTIAAIARRYAVTRQRAQQIVSAQMGGGKTLTNKRRRAVREASLAEKRRAQKERQNYRGSLAFIEDNSTPDEDGCWIWNRSLFPTGYGHTTIAQGAGYAHRHAWEVANGMAVPGGLCICHTCDVPSCVNPAHLFLGTYSDNTRDAVSKGRHIASPLHPLHSTMGKGPRSARTYCVHGHEFTPENTYVAPSGQRACRVCARRRVREYRSRRAQRVAA